MWRSEEIQEFLVIGALSRVVKGGEVHVELKTAIVFNPNEFVDFVEECTTPSTVRIAASSNGDHINALAAWDSWGSLKRILSLETPNFSLMSFFTPQFFHEPAQH
jgi:hypothetical protein